MSSSIELHINLNSFIESSFKSNFLSIAYATVLPTISCASLNGTPFFTR